MLEEHGHDGVGLRAVERQAQFLVLGVSSHERIDRVALKPRGQRAQLLLREPFLDEQVLAHVELVAADSSASKAWTEVEQCGL